MEQTVAISREDIPKLVSECCGSELNENIGVVNVSWREKTLAVRTFIGLKNMMQMVRAVVSGCYDEGENYMPEAKDFYIRLLTVEYYADIELPENVEEKVLVLYGTDLVQKICETINHSQYAAIMNAIDERISYINQSNIRRIEEDATRIVEETAKLYNGVATMFEGLDKESVQGLINAMSKFQVDEKKLVNAVIDAKNNADGTLKVVK